MKSLMTFIGILAFNFSFANASEFTCPVPQAFSNYTCSGTVRVQDMDQLNAYKNNLGVMAKKPTVAKGLLIDFSPVLSADLNIATPCMIKTSPNITITTTGNVCLNGKRKILLDEGFHFSGKNLNLESSEDVVVSENSVFLAQDIKLLSKGSGKINQAFFREGAQITAANVLIESHNVGFVGRNSNLQLTGSLAIHALGDEEASIRQGTVVVANKIDVNSTGITKIADLTKLTASEISLIGAQGCDINKGSVMTTTSRIGNCFLESSSKDSFSVDKNSGTNPLTVTFNASTIAGAKGFVWDFGNGQTLNTLVSTVTHTYTTVGSFTATLMYATKDNYKGLKSAGLVKIDVKAAPVVTTTPPRGYFTYAQDGTFVYLKGFIRKTQFDIATAYYVIDDNQNNKIYMSNFYANSQANVEMNTFGQHKITMYVEDVQGQKYNTSMNIWLNNNEKDIAPFIRFYGEQSAVRTAFINMYQSFTPHPDENLKEFTVDFGDSQIEHVENAASVTHTYAQAGTYNVKVSAEYNGNVRSGTQSITVSDVNKPVLNPIAGFYYYILDYSGNVVLTDDRSSTPNGEIISYEWNFGNGLITYGQQASHFFEPGDHLVTLTVTDIAGLRSSQTQLIRTEEIGTNFVAALDCWKEGIKTLECEVIALDSANQVSRVKLEWGDGTSKIYTEAEISAWGLFVDEHIYQNYGTYNIKLTVNTSRGETKYAYYEQKILQAAPVATLNCSINSSTASCGAQVLEGQPSRFVFDFGDGTIIETTINHAEHVYTMNGNYQIVLKVYDSNGNFTETNMNVQINQIIYRAPIAQGSCVSTTAEMLTCISYSFDPNSNGPITSSWVVDGQSYNGEIVYINIASGPKIIQLTAKNLIGLVGVTSINALVQENKKPIAYFECSNNVIGTELNCESKSSDLDGRIISYQWKVNNEIVSTQSKFNLQLSENFSLNVSLIITDNLGKTGELNKSIDTAYLPSNTDVLIGKCKINDSLRYKKCATGYFEATNQDLLNEYLTNGKFTQNNELLNLRIKGNLNVDKVSIATPCDIEVDDNITINSLENLCILGKNLKLKPNTSIISNGDINLLANERLILDNSQVNTIKNVTVTTSNLTPLSGGIELVGFTKVQSSSSAFITPSVLNISVSSDLISEVINFSAGKCIIPLIFSYEGSCNTNVPNEDINFNYQFSDSKLVLEATGEDQEKVYWKINDEFEHLEDNVFNAGEYIPGIYNVSMATVDGSGFISSVSKNIELKKNQYYQYDLLLVKYYSKGEYPEVLHAQLGNQSIVLTKLDNWPIYFYQLENLVSDTSLVISDINFTMNISVIPLPSEGNIDEFINNYYDDLQRKINSLPTTNQSSINFKTQMNIAITQAREEFLTLDAEAKVIAVGLLKINSKDNASLFTVLSPFFKIFNVVESAYAQYEEMGQANWINELKQSLAKTNIFGVISAGSGAMGLFFIKSSLGNNIDKKLKLALRTTGGGLLLTAVLTYKMAKAHAEDVLINAFIPDPDSIRAEHEGVLKSGVVTKFYFPTSFVPGDSNISKSNAVNEVVLKVEEANDEITMFNRDFKEMGIIDPLSFPQSTTSFNLNPKKIVKVEIVKTSNGNASISQKIPEGENLYIIIASEKSQKITLRFRYEDSGFDIKKEFEYEVNVVSSLGDITLGQGNRDFSFSYYNADLSMVGKKLRWNFGDGDTKYSTDAITLHRYKDQGMYNASVEIYDDNNILYASKTFLVNVVDQWNATIVNGNVDHPDTYRDLQAYLSPTTYSGYPYQVFSSVGICYTTGVLRGVIGGIDEYYIPLYNCSSYDLIKNQ